MKRLARGERDATVELVVHLAVVLERRLYLEEGCGSMFSYCTRVLHLAEHATYNRIEAACMARRFPIILEMLADGSVNLTTVRLLAPHLTPQNHLELLRAAMHKTTHEVKQLVASIRPLPSVPPSIRKLPPPRKDTEQAADEPDRPMSAGSVCGSHNSSTLERTRRRDVGASSTGILRISTPSGRDLTAGPRPLSGPVHSERTTAREDTACPGSAAASDPRRQSGGSDGPSADDPPRAAGAAKNRRRIDR